MQEIWALRDVSFEVKRGESFAVIGRNGSGKSTLLEIITQTLTPTSGSVKVNGRVAALLELGSGFNPDYTGRENVLLNGLLLGLSRTEVDNRFDDIVGFADIGDVLDRPVKTYSSGMLVRLAFAVQVALEPDILIVDEALSVGDYFFQQKCFGRLRKMRENGLTLLFVSHDMGTVRDLCKQAIYLRKGLPVFVGDTTSAVRHYFNEGVVAASVTTSMLGSSVANAGSQRSSLDAAIKNAIWSREPTAVDRIISVRVCDEQDLDIDRARLGSDIFVKVYYRSFVGDAGTTVGLAIKNRYDQIVFVTNSERLGVENCDTSDTSSAVFLFKLSLTLEAGLYTLKANITQPTGCNKGEELDTSGWMRPFCIEWDYEKEQAPFLGMFGLSASGHLSLLS
jgi:lipopolysaccharide transport system ATP-binding protein